MPRPTKNSPLADLQRESEAWNDKVNRDCTKINWQFTRKKARQKFGYKRSQEKPIHTV